MAGDAAPDAVLISGATGLVGRRLREALRPRGLRQRLLTRRPEQLRAEPPDEAVGWDGTHVPSEAIAGCRAVIHLSGEPIFGGVPSARRRELMQTSRVDSTRSLVAGIEAAPPEARPRTLVSASAVGFYGDAGDRELDESASPGVGGFLAALCAEWEAAAAPAAELGVRVVTLRIGVVFAPGEGALALMAPVFRAGLGGRLGSGRQWFPWIHASDLVRLILHVLDSPEIEGPVNAVSPEPVTNQQLTEALGRVLGRPTFLAVPGFAIRTALGPLATEFLDSRRVVPAVARDTGFTFSHPGLEDALRDVLRPDA